MRRHGWNATALVVGLMACGALASATAQGAKEDYERASQLTRKWQGKVAHERLRIGWLDGGKRVYYPRGRGKDRTFVIVDCATGERKTTREHPDPKAQPRRRERGRRRSRGSRRRGSARRSATHELRLEKQQLVLLERTSRRVVLRTKDGTADHAWTSGFFSPDGKLVVGVRATRPESPTVTWIETSPKEQLRPKTRTRTYRRPGDALPRYSFAIFEVATGKRRDVDFRAGGIDPVEAMRPPRPTWREDGARFVFEHRHRGHRHDRVIEVDTRDGKTRVVWQERAKTFFDHTSKFVFRILAGAKRFVRSSERSGWNHLYLHDGETGKILSALTAGEWVVRGVDRVDEAKGKIWIRACGKNAGQDPYFVHSYRIDLATRELTALTHADGTHSIEWSPSREFYVDRWSRVDHAPVHELRRGADGTLVCVLEKADVTPLRKVGWRAPEVFVAKARDGVTDIWGLIHRPSDFDPKKRYPVLEAIYAGPHGAHVPKAFRAVHSAQRRAELGFIVVQIDGMGTNFRSKAFLDHCWKNIADAGFPDRIAWMKAAAAKHPQLDLSRVGIYGTSAGGQNAMGALLFHGDFYRAAMAACGCHDNRLDKLWWNEQWMGYPVGEHYEKQSNITNAHRLQGKLFLIVGELDSNVPPESTMRVVDALVRADKDFDLLVVPGMGHSSGGRYGQRRTDDFFVRSLLGVEPRR